MPPPVFMHAAAGYPHSFRILSPGRSVSVPPSRCLGLAFSVIGGLFAGLPVMIIAAFTAAGVTYWLSARRDATSA